MGRRVNFPPSVKIMSVLEGGGERFVKQTKQNVTEMDMYMCILIVYSSFFWSELKILELIILPMFITVLF